MSPASLSPAYQICTRCVMDTSDPAISFDAQGVCSHCRRFDLVISKAWHPNEHGAAMLSAQLDHMRAERRGQEYDCIMGLSGGIDSSYLALKVKEMNIRPLVVHVDAGWNSELAVHNIERVVNYCGFDLTTVVIDWEEMRDLQVAYLRAGVANQDVPQDHAFFASLYRYAIKHGIRHVINGSNYATESVLPQTWGHSAMDGRNLKAIHKRHGTRPLRTFPVLGFVEKNIYYPYIRKMKVLRPLNLMPYDKRHALRHLQATIGYKDYAYKHGESVFTRFFQNHYLPAKFGYDKRRAHLSSEILAGLTTRETALQLLQEPLYDPNDLQRDKTYIAKKLRLPPEEFEALLLSPGHAYFEYANQDQMFRIMRAVKRLLLGRRKASLDPAGAQAGKS